MGSGLRARKERDMVERETLTKGATKAEKRAWLRDHGWTQWGSYASSSWRSPDPADRSFYTLAAALMKEVSKERRES